MRIVADRPKGILTLNNTVYFSISNRVRTLRNGTRRSDEVVRTTPGNLPYDPMPFPQGVWHITEVEWQKDRGFDYNVYGPVKIRTDAWQWAKVWELDEDGDYLRERGDEVKDYGYLLHFSCSTSTYGCIRLASPQYAETLATLIEKTLKSGESVELEVI